jgi:transporter family protein
LTALSSIHRSLLDLPVDDVPSRDKCDYRFHPDTEVPPVLNWVVFALLAAVFAAAVTVFAKIGLARLDATVAAAVRATVMTLFLIGAAGFSGRVRSLLVVDKTALLWIVASGVAGGMSWLCYFLALRDGPAAGVAALDRLSVVFVLLLGALMLPEPATARSLLGAGLFTLGAILMTLG